ncbi:polysaccharide pyruvyl transferase [Verrucomicrobiaceae bacterium SCGC AG-212-N21]|nr:polysaccharide pyruvyl transferase [Verrucomicrobiaceae bacterium SCGC AG-212-N21]
MTHPAQTPLAMNRRHFLTTALASTLASLPAAEGRPRRIVLRSSWQTVNIGDIAHTPGVLALLEKHLPDVEVRLWPSSVDNGVEEMLMKRFPKLKIIKGREDILAAFKECDFLLHGSGPGFVAKKDVAKWREETGKPYGIYCITISSMNSEYMDLLSTARFVYFRDSVSLKLAQDRGVKCPLMEFCPEGSFAVDLRNDAAAEVFLKANNLEPGKFLCCIPRYRNTPYWKIKKGYAFDEKKHARNEAMKEHDLGPLREAIVQVVKQTDMKVLVCPEDASQMEIGKEMLIDKLPEDVKSRVAWRPNYWLTDEALSTYVRSAGLFGAEMHSPIMCIGNGIPAIVCRWAEQTSKGYMWRDIGLGEWLFNMDEESEIPGILPAVLAMAKDPAAAKAKAEKARDLVRDLQKKSMETVGRMAQASA